MFVAFECTHSKRGDIPTTEIKITEEVKTFIEAFKNQGPVVQN